MASTTTCNYGDSSVWGESILSSANTHTAISNYYGWGTDYGSSSTSSAISYAFGTSYAGNGAWGQQGILIPNQLGDANIQLQRQRDAHSMNIRLGARIEFGYERRAAPMPQTWGNWIDAAYDTAVTQHSYTVEFQPQVWQQWITTQQEAEPFARQQLSQEALRATDEEFQRRQAEMQRAATEQARAYEERIKKERDQKANAEETAQVLLGELIGDEELAVYKETGRVLVKGKSHDYMLHVGGKVQRIEKNKITDLCVHVSQRPLIPDTDNVIGLALHIKADEKDFNKVANLVTVRERGSELPRAANG